MHQQNLVQSESCLEVLHFKGRLVELYESPDEESIVIQEARYYAFPIFVPMVQPSLFVNHIRQDEIGRLPSSLRVRRLTEDRSSPGQGCNHQSVPVHQDLLVLMGVDPFFAALE